MGKPKSAETKSLPLGLARRERFSQAARRRYRLKEVIIKQLLAALAVTAFALPAFAQQTAQPPSPATAAQAELTARQFIRSVAVGNMFEIQSSQIALDKSNNQDIQGFARQMVADHRKAGEELQAILARADGLSADMPRQLDQAHRQKLEQLKTAAGMDFDRSYRQMQSEAHQETIALFDAYAKNGDNAEPRRWAQDTLPTLRGHLEQAQAIALPRTTGKI